MPSRQRFIATIATLMIMSCSGMVQSNRHAFVPASSGEHSLELFVVVDRGVAHSIDDLKVEVHLKNNSTIPLKIEYTRNEFEGLSMEILNSDNYLVGTVPYATRFSLMSIEPLVNEVPPGESAVRQVYLSTLI